MVEILTSRKNLKRHTRARAHTHTYIYIYIFSIILTSNIIPSIFRFAMEKRMTRSIFILALVMGMILEQSTAAEFKYTYKECYHDCRRLCSYTTYGNYRAAFGCLRCDFTCRKKLNGEVCFFDWCWKLKK